MDLLKQSSLKYWRIGWLPERPALITVAKYRYNRKAALQLCH